VCTLSFLGDLVGTFVAGNKEGLVVKKNRERTKRKKKKLAGDGPKGTNCASPRWGEWRIERGKNLPFWGI